MLIANPCYQEMIDSPARSIKARVELLEGSTLLNTFSHGDSLKTFSVERAGDTSKLFGYGICQKLKVELLDKERKISIAKGQRLEIAVGVGCEYIYPCPVFFVDEITRDENTNALTVIAYDALNEASKHAVREIDVYGKSYTVTTFAASCATLLGMPIKYEQMGDDCFCLDYPEGANFTGNETIRQALDAVAEATQTIYFMNNEWELVFKRLDVQGLPALTIDKSKYFTLKSKTDIRLAGIVHTTELGDNTKAEDITINGVIQYIRDNPFWNLRDDVSDLVAEAWAAIKGLSINQFECSWRGNFLLEIGDKIAMITKDNEIVYSYLLNDVMNYNGGFNATSQWNYTESSSEKATGAPATIGEKMKQTSAKVDQVNKRIDLVVEDTTTLILEQNRISASVSEMSTDIDNLTKRVDISVTPTEVEFQIQSALSSGAVNEITTSTGFTFNDEGLTISKSGTEMNTTVSEDGMVVYRGTDEMLNADHEGVKAMNLHATTYLYIGAHSLLQDYDLDGSQRTGCFWIEK
jgi:hypothetical protein